MRFNWFIVALITLMTWMLANFELTAQQGYQLPPPQRLLRSLMPTRNPRSVLALTENGESISTGLPCPALRMFPEGCCVWPA